ncbi:MAG TPA: hypothetical protein VK808_02135, partial [Bacteroidia bacterium]|nr:hypothetical protein [Bacteroidia bacterium]
MKKITCYLLLSILALGLKAQIISTIAGNGWAGYTGDGGPATAAEINTPPDISSDNSGNIWIADVYNNCIRYVNVARTITTVAGNGVRGYSGDGGPATAAELAEPWGVAQNGSGTLYIADYSNNRIREVNSSGIISTVAGNGVYGYTGDGGPATAAEVGEPIAVAFDPFGNYYIVDNTIRKVTGNIISTVAGANVFGYSGDGGPATAAELNDPTGIAADASGNYYIADYHNNRIRKVNISGIISTIAGNGVAGYSGDGGPATAAELNLPWSVTLDASGNIYIADMYNACIREVNTSGIISTVAGMGGHPGFTGDGGLATAAEMYYPS